MTTQQVLSLAAVFLNKQELLPLIEQTQQPADNIETKHYELLLKSLNLCYQEISLDYLPLLFKEQLLIQNNKIYIEDLQKQPKDIYVISSLDQSKTYKFKVYDNYIDTNVNGNVNITYSYVPDELTITSQVNNFAGRISLKCLAMGTVAEFCYILGLYEDAALWEHRYKSLLKIETRKKAELKLPSRRWL